jgi:hypothetical protein
VFHEQYINTFLSLAFLQNFNRWEVDAGKIVFSQIIQDKLQHLINCSRLATAVQNGIIQILPKHLPHSTLRHFFSTTLVRNIFLP